MVGLDQEGPRCPKTARRYQPAVRVIVQQSPQSPSEGKGTAVSASSAL